MSIPILAALFPSSCYLISSFLLSLSRDGSMPPHLPYTWFNTQSSKLHRCCSGCPLKPDWGSASWDLVMMMILYRRLTRAGPTFQHVTPSATTLVVNIAKHKYVWHPVEQRKSVGRLSWSEGSAKDWLWWQHTEKKTFVVRQRRKLCIHSPQQHMPPSAYSSHLFNFSASLAFEVLESDRTHTHTDEYSCILI